MTLTMTGDLHMLLTVHYCQLLDPVDNTEWKVLRPTSSP